MPLHVPQINPFGIGAQPAARLPSAPAPIPTAGDPAPNPITAALTDPLMLAALQASSTLLAPRAPGTSQGAQIAAGLAQGAQSLAQSTQAEEQAKVAGEDRALDRELKTAQVGKITAETEELGKEDETDQKLNEAKIALTKARTDFATAQAELARSKVGGGDPKAAQKKLEAQRKLVLQHTKTLGESAFLKENPDQAALTALRDGLDLLDQIDKGTIGDAVDSTPPEFQQFGKEEWAKLIANPQLRQQIEERYGAAKVAQHLQSLGLE